MNRLVRRDFLKTSSALAAASLLPSCAMEPAAPSRPIGRVIVIGGGFGGATAAKYLRMWSEGTIEVFLIERNPEFISCPTSNLVLGGTRTLSELTRSYAKLREYGVQVLRDEATAINVEKKRVSLKRIEDLPYDRLIVSPAVDFMYEAIEGYDAEAQKTILHAWKAGPETVALRQQLEAMPDGGVCVIGAVALPLPAGALRARLPDCVLLQEGQAALQGDRSRRQ
jgi:sulfite dehydrogenase